MHWQHMTRGTNVDEANGTLMELRRAREKGENENIILNKVMFSL